MPVVVANNRAIVFSPISGCTEELAHWPKRYAAVVVVFVEELFILAPSIICVSHIGNKTTAESHANIKCYREKRNSFILLICLHKYTLVTRMLWLILCRWSSCSWGFPVVSAMDWTYSLLHSFLAVWWQLQSCFLKPVFCYVLFGSAIAIGICAILEQCLCGW